MVVFSSAQECESIEYKYIIQNDKVSIVDGVTNL